MRPYFLPLARSGGTLAVALLLHGCIVSTAADIAATGVKAGAKVGGAAVGVTAGALGSAGRAVTGGK